MLDSSAFPLPINLAAFAAAGVVVWFAGTRLARYADAIAEITGLGSALIGMLLLGGSPPSRRSRCRSPRA
jgi:cation:H+ antiporter